MSTSREGSNPIPAHTDRVTHSLANRRITKQPANREPGRTETPGQGTLRALDHA